MDDPISVTAPPVCLRDAYLDELSEFQELYLERMVVAGRTWCWPGRAYVVVCDSQIVEFFVEQKFRNDAPAFFEAAGKVGGATAALCKSFDTHLLFPACIRPARVVATSILFRRIAPCTVMPPADTAFRQGRVSDTVAIRAFDDGFFSSEEEIVRYARADALYLMEQEGKIVACGIETRVIPGRPAVDIGMLVSPEMRGNGYGTHMAAYVKDEVQRKGMSPICGCAASNVASYRALLKAGFRAEHHILRIELGNA